MDEDQSQNNQPDTEEQETLPPHVQAMKDAGAPESQVANAAALAKQAPDEPGAGKPYEYPPQTFQPGDPNDPANQTNEEEASENKGE